MEIEVRKYNEYFEVSLKDGFVEINSGFLDKHETENLATVFLDAYRQLVGHTPEETAIIAKIKGECERGDYCDATYSTLGDLLDILER